MIDQYSNFTSFYPIRNATIQSKSEAIEEKKVILTEQAVLNEYEKFDQNVHKSSLHSRHVFWLS